MDGFKARNEEASGNNIQSLFKNKDREIMEQAWHVLMIHETEQKGLFKVAPVIQIWIYLESN